MRTDELQGGGETEDATADDREVILRSHELVKVNL
jgi:hypothetical protein